ncbi:MAG: hypothetical protein HQ518_01375 [Rhodopirellula sp.]|nr:hypothetical protein [Rhodopirellula sp.]
MIRAYAGSLLLVFLFASDADAQQAPSIGYMFPPGGQAGSTVDVVLGGYDWTPDMELFVRDARIQLELAGAPGPVIVPEPPYWFGKKARRGPFPMPRETHAKLKLPVDLSPGIYRWQAANANGATASGKFVVSDVLEVVEERGRQVPQHLTSLPVTVSGQILKIEEVDEFRFTAPATGPMSCEIVSAAIGSPLTAVVEIRDASGRLIADVADTAARDAAFTFAVEAGQQYFVRVYDIDFRGNRSFVYRLSLTPGPRLVSTIPAVVQRGTTREIEFVGYGLQTGAAKLESLTRSFEVPADPAAESFQGQLDLSNDQSVSFHIPVSDLSEQVEVRQQGKPAQTPMDLSFPSAMTGVLDQRYGIDRYRLSGAKGDVWVIDVQAESLGSPLDVSLAVVKEDSTELQRVDDVPGTTDARLVFTVPADGSYDLLVSDTSGSSGNRQAIYRLVLQQASPGFRLTVPELHTVSIGGSTVLAIKAERTGGFTGPISVAVDGLPEGVSIPADAAIPEKKNDLKLNITAAADAGTIARLITVTGTATIDDAQMQHSPEPVLLAVTLKPPFTITAEGRDDVTKWPRGTTFPAPVLIERDESFKGDIVLEMHSKQGRHRQGIRGPEMTIKPGENRVHYPVFLPEWLETTRTSRMVVNGVAEVADPKGRVRYLSSKLVTRIGFLPTGAMLKIESPVPEIELSSDDRFDFPVSIFRAPELTGPFTVELVPETEDASVFSAATVQANEKAEQVVLRVTHPPGHAVSRVVVLKVRATGNWNGYPVIAETTLSVVPISTPARKVAMP